MSKLISFKDFTRNALTKIKTSWGKLRAKLKSLINSKLKKAEPGEEVQIKIPAIGSDNLISEARSGDIEAIKGNYNEALLLQMIYETDNPVIQISDKYKKNKSAIDQKVKQWDDALKKASGGQKAKPAIEQGTKAMLQYLIQTTKQADSIIIGGFLDNLSFQRGGIGTKGDIGLHIMKEGKEELQDFSLKLYGSKSVGLANSTAPGLANHLGGEEAKQAVNKIIETDKDLQLKLKIASRLDLTKQALKDYLKDDEKKKKSGLNRLLKYGYTEAEIKKLDVNKIGDERQLARTDINPRLAEIVFDVLEKYQKKNPKKFTENLLEILGFNDHDTKILMAVTTKKGSIIIDRHPELDLNNIKLERTGVSIKVVGPTGKTVVTFGFKEGEKKAVSGKVSYASVPIFTFEEVDITYEMWNNILDHVETDLIIENMLSESVASDKAKKLNLKHFGRGSYGKGDMITHRVSDGGDKLVKLDKPQSVDSKDSVPDDLEKDYSDSDEKTQNAIKNVFNAVKDHVKEIRQDFKEIGLGDKDIINSLREKDTYSLMKSVGFKTKQIGNIALKSAKTIRVGLDGVSKEILDTKFGKSIQRGTAKIDEVLDRYPNMKKITGTAVAGFAIYQWLNMSFSGDIESDYDLTVVEGAIAGNFTLSEVLASPGGMTGLGLLAAGLATGGLPIWIGGAKGISMALAYSGLKNRAKDNPELKEKVAALKEKISSKIKKGELDEGDGLWANIHKRRKSGKRMRKKGEKGAPTAADFKRAKGESFKSITEASVKGKNVHMTHIEDRVLYGGVKGAREAIFALRGMRDMLSGQSNKKVDATVKWDGAPAVFAGIDPTDGQFFVAKKGIFNKNPKVYKSESDVRADTSGDLADKLVIAFQELKKLGIQNVVQGDLLFTDDVDTETIDGTKYYTFQPNTIVYAVPVDSDLGKRIRTARIGIIFHTTYTGKDFESMKASYKVDINSMKKTGSVFFDDANIKDQSGSVTLTKKETAEVTEAISKAGKIFQKIAGTTLRQIEREPTLAQELETFNNTFVRRGEKIGNSKEHVKKLLAWYEDKYSKEMIKRKSDAGKEKVLQKKKEKYKFFSAENKKNLEQIFELQKQIVVAKELIISKLDKIKSMDTFVRTKHGFKVTGQEGYVAIDKTSGGVVKLVDRLEFSYNNFSPDTIKGWDK